MRKKKKAPEGAQEKISISEYIKGGILSTMEAKQPSYYWRNREKCLAYAREYRVQNKAKRKAYYDAHQDEILAKQKVRYQRSKLEIMKNHTEDKK